MPFTNITEKFSQEQISQAQKLEPLGDRIIALPLELGTDPTSLILIPETAKEKPQTARVLAVGPGKVEDGKKIACELKRDDIILYGKYAGTEIIMSGIEYVILRESDVIAKVRK